MKLYYFPLSSYSQKALMAFYEKGVSFEKAIVNLFDPVARAEYLAIYPIGKVPLLVRDDRISMGESSVIIEYLDLQVSTGPKLIPSDPEEALKVRAMDRWFDLYVNDPATTLTLESMKPDDKRDEKAMRGARKTLDKMFPILDKHFAKREWAAGTQQSMADCAAAPALAYCGQVYPFETFENLDRYAKHLRELPSFARVLEETAAFNSKR